MYCRMGGDLDLTTSGLSHLPPSSERMGHYLCVGVQETAWSSHFRPSPLRSEGRDDLENRGSFPGTDTREPGLLPRHRYTRA